MEMLARLQDIFYEFKDSTADRVTDRELLNFMREQFDEVCFGDADYLEDTCLDRFAAGVRAGYSGYQQSEGRGVYEQFSGEARYLRLIMICLYSFFLFSITRIHAFLKSSCV